MGSRLKKSAFHQKLEEVKNKLHNNELDISDDFIAVFEFKVLEEDKTELDDDLKAITAQYIPTDLDKIIQNWNISTVETMVDVIAKVQIKFTSYADKLLHNYREIIDESFERLKQDLIKWREDYYSNESEFVLNEGWVMESLNNWLSDVKPEVLDFSDTIGYDPDLGFTFYKNWEGKRLDFKTGDLLKLVNNQIKLIRTNA